MSGAPRSAAEAERRAEAIRADMVRTIEQLGSNLSPSRLKQDAFAAVQDRTPPWLVSYWRFVRSPSALALVLAICASVASTAYARQQPRRRRRR